MSKLVRKCQNNEEMRSIQTKGGEIMDIEIYKSILVKKVWNIHDVSLYTGIPVGSLYNMTHQEKIPFRKKGNRLFFISKEIMNWIEEGE